METKFNINDEVYIIELNKMAETEICPDCDVGEVNPYWDVSGGEILCDGEHIWNIFAPPMLVEVIHIDHNGIRYGELDWDDHGFEDYETMLHLKAILKPEEDLFYTIKEAKAECKKRNEDNNA